MDKVGKFIKKNQSLLSVLVAFFALFITVFTPYMRSVDRNKSDIEKLVVSVHGKLDKIIDRQQEEKVFDVKYKAENDNNIEKIFEKIDCNSKEIVKIKKIISGDK